jgi:hypothetical protein
MLSAPAAGASGVPQPATGFAWSETSGWVDFAPTGGGVVVHDDHLSGFAWAENLGWIRFGGGGGGPYANTSATDWGVNRRPTAPCRLRLVGASGWIRFDPASAA